MAARRAILAAATMAAAAAWAGADQGQDHPLLPRYPGATIAGYDFKEYEESQLVLFRPMQRNGQVPADKVLPVEGRVTYLHYEVPPNVSTLQVFRNYQSALRRAGFQELFSCDRPCGDVHFSNWRPLLKANRLYLNGGADQLFYVAAQRDTVYVSIGVTTIGERAQVFEIVTEKTALDDQKISVTGSSAIAQALARSGRVDIYGFLFDTGKSQLKPDSAPTLKELAQVLKDNPRLAVDVVGHTDDVGNADANQALSLGRAQAVSAALISDYGIAPDRLAASGRGATQPVAPNQTEDGRARNRRVEIALRGTGVAVAAPAPSAPPAVPAPKPVPAAEPAPAPASSEPKKISADRVLDAAKKLKDLFSR